MFHQDYIMAQLSAIRWKQQYYVPTYLIAEVDHLIMEDCG